MKRLHILIILIHLCMGIHAQNKYDVVIVGGNPGGIMAAIAAARQGKTSVILERTKHIGGLPANGLGATDIATREATTGLFKEFTDRVKQHYINRYGAHSQQVKDCSDGFHFEPSVASEIYAEMLSEHKDKITVLLMRQFDAAPSNIEIQNGVIQNIDVINRETEATERYIGKIFIDATYEGDLGAAAGVAFRVGRESKEEFNEPGAGRTYEYWKSLPAEGSTGERDNAIQAYNYRLCLTNDPTNRVEITKPSTYNREDYISLIEDVWTGKNTNRVMQNVTEEMMEDNRRHITAGNPSKLPGDNWGIRKLSSIVKLPNQKVDGNNQHAAFISTDLPEENWAWPTSSWDWRDKFAQRLKDYTLGLLWFAQNDVELPEHFRKTVAEWGLAKDEYEDNNHFPRQVYVREGRRFEGVYFFTAKDALPVETGKRPPLHLSSITASHYALDSHAARKREPGRVHLDGFISYPTAVYTVPLGVILPKNISNLMLPVPVSGSHIGFSTLRMEPCWSALGQAAGITASLAIDRNTSVQNVDIHELQDSLLAQKATLIYFRDIRPGDSDFKLSQYMGLRGYLPEWDANLQLPIDETTLHQWSALCGFRPKTSIGKSTRKEVLSEIYSRISKDDTDKTWVLGPFERPENVNPIIEPSLSTFNCPMRKEKVKWEEGDTFNPAATVKDGKIVILYRAEDKSGHGIGKRTSRIGYAESSDGVTIKKSSKPVLFPDRSDFEKIEAPGGCEDPRVAMTEDGLYVMLYTAWNRKTPRLAVATSKDLKHWTKHGLAFEKAYDGRFTRMANKSASILTKIKDGKLVIDKVDGKYFMYWGEYAVHAATSENLIDWYPVLDKNGDLLRIATPRKGYFDSQMTECGPPAIRTENGIVLIYNGKNDYKYGDKQYPAGAYCAGQMLMDNDDPLRMIDRLDAPFFKPEADFEKSGQYKDGTVFVEGLAAFSGKFYLYYGCADSKVSVAIADIERPDDENQEVQ